MKLLRRRKSPANNSLSVGRRFRRRSTHDSPVSVVSTVVSEDDDLDQVPLVSPTASVLESPCRALVLYEDRPNSVTEAMNVWIDSVVCLAQSDEFSNFVGSTAHLIQSAGHVAVQTALLPVTLPLHVCTSTTELLVGTLMHIMCLESTSSSSSTPPLMLTEEASTTSQLNQEDTRRNSENQEDDTNLLQKVFGFPSFCLDVAGHLTQEAGSIALHVVSPVLTSSKEEDHGDQNRSKTETTQEENYLDRLRLDFAEPPSQKGPSSRKRPASKQTIFLLRVNDLGLCHKKAAKVQGKEAILVDYIDMEQGERKLIQTALDRLVRAGLSLVANHPSTRLDHPYKTTELSDITWKMEDNTAKILKKMSKLPTLDRLRLLQRETLLWSGRYSQSSPDASLSKARKPTFYLARGIVRRGPKDFMHLLWDNSRTNEYNSHSMGRQNILTLDDDVLTGKTNTGTKVIRSETRVPFTGLSVHVNCLMHVRPLEAPDQGFVIVSRSLGEGPAGMHLHGNLQPSDMKSSKSDILWGVNIIRAVPNHPDLTDLTSLSQVGSSVVPKFLAGKIAAMGVSDFFAAVRA